MATHPLRRSADRSRTPGPGTVSLVVLVARDDPDPGRFLDRLPDSVDQVVTVEAPGAGRPFRWPDIAWGDRVVLIQADGSMSPDDIPHFLYYLDHGFDFVKGSRFIAGGECTAYPAFRRMGHRVLLTAARRLYGQQLTDVWYGFCAFRREFLSLLEEQREPPELVGPETVVHALHYGLRIAEVPSREAPGSDRRTTARTFHEGRRILRVLWRERPRNALLRFAARHRRGCRPRERA
ncbi:MULTISPECIES: glycosyltransferase [unclassified Streptomyces]|uniref:glycosyltransferase n=1 Tax=unclassified Streptomyces TaxID=2593676 RepID=UPI003332D6BD